METCITVIKSIYLSITGWIAASFLFFAPIHYLWEVALILWGVNVLFGYLSGRMINMENLVWKKFMRALFEVAIYLFITLFMFLIGKLQNEGDEMLKGLNVISWALVAFYVVNILKNICRLLPGESPVARFFRYLYLVVSLDWITRLPHFQEYLNQEKQENHG